GAGKSTRAPACQRAIPSMPPRWNRPSGCNPACAAPGWLHHPRGAPALDDDGRRTGDRAVGLHPDHGAGAHGYVADAELAVGLDVQLAVEPAVRAIDHDLVAGLRLAGNAACRGLRLCRTGEAECD